MSNFMKYSIIALGVAGFSALGFALDWLAIYSVYNPVTRMHYAVESVRWEILGYRASYFGDFGGVWTLSFFQFFIAVSVVSLVLLVFFWRHKPQ